MAQTTVLVLLSQTAYVNPDDGSAYFVAGEVQPAASYYLGNQSLQTVQYSLQECTGNLIIEATLSRTPDELDWFRVFELAVDNEAPAGSPEKLASDAKSFANIEGNFVYLRAKMLDFKHGVINFLKVSY